jgi:hypothetical protein
VSRRQQPYLAPSAPQFFQQAHNFATNAESPYLIRQQMHREISTSVHNAAIKWTLVLISAQNVEVSLHEFF